MKHLYKLITVTLVLLITWSSSALGQQADTLVVPWLDGDNLRSNGLYETIIADTTADGERVPNRVYELEQGGFYYVTEIIQNDGWHLNIVGQESDPNDEFANPPMLQIGVQEGTEGDTPGKMFNVRGDFTLKNVIVNGKTTLGELQYEIIDVRYDGGSFVFDNNIFEFSQWGIMGFYSNDANIYYTNNITKNLISENEPWGGRGFSVWADVDTVWVENNTFHNNGFTVIQVEGASANYVWFNQNTIVNNGRQIMLWMWVQEAYFTNNVILNPFWHGEDPATEIGSERAPDEQESGYFAFQNLPAEYGLDLQRRILIANNAFYTTQEFEDWYASSDIIKQPILNERARNLFDANENMVESGNTFDVNPGFMNYADNHQEAIDFITKIRNSETVSSSDVYYWDRNERDFSDHESIEWPLTDDLTYSNTSLQSAAIGSYPLGDLNWYPSDKSNWEANKEAQYDDILNLLGGEVEVEFVKSVEAESGTVSGDAAVVEMDDKNLVRVEASGEPTWEINLDAAGTYDVVVKKRTWYADDATERQTDILVNGENVGNVTMGMEITEDLPWAEPVLEGVAFEEGANTIALGYSWGFMEYESVTVMNGSEEVMTLYPAQTISLNGAQFRCPEGGFCASRDKFVDLTNGGLTVPVNIDSDGQYTIQMTYMVLGGGDASSDISINGSEAMNQIFSGEDSTFVELSINDISLQSGDNTLEFSNVAGNLGIDRFDLFIIKEVGVSNEPLELVKGYELRQNYPNPFNPSTQISFTLPQSSDVSLSVYNVIGQRVAVLANEVLQSGQHTYQFDASNLASGMYLYRLQTDNFSQVRKMTLIK
ncbi:hypothetical protein BH23BAC3_BH23BAC3_04300 [soil metagenome]